MVLFIGLFAIAYHWLLAQRHAAHLAAIQFYFKATSNVEKHRLKMRYTSVNGEVIGAAKRGFLS
jgi:hypothetical protein